MKREPEHDPTQRVRIGLPFDDAIRRALKTPPPPREGRKRQPVKRKAAATSKARRGRAVHK